MSSRLAIAALSAASSERLKALQGEIAAQRAALVTHPMYRQIDSLPRLHLFMRHHAFAVWDFMSLLKWLQQKLTCTTVPWVPRGDAVTRRLINQIVLAEETDGDDGALSHYEMYLRAMQQCAAPTNAIEQFVACVSKGEEVSLAIQHASIPPAACTFVLATFELLATNSPHQIAAAFALGREDLIPEMFTAIVNDLRQQLPGQLSCFHDYLERHIELDGDEHTPLAMRMLAQLCGDDDECWRDAADAARQSLVARKALWDGVLAEFASQ